MVPEGTIRMDTSEIGVRRLGLAVGSTCALFYLGCMFVMAMVPHETAIAFFNSILHGVDVTPIVRWEMPLWEAVVGVIEVFILGWMFGAVIAGIYNAATRFGVRS